MRGEPPSGSSLSAAQGPASSHGIGVKITKLEYTDHSLGCLPFPKQQLHLSAGIGSGLTRRRGDPPGVVWAICDRGPNIKLPDAAELYGWSPPHEIPDEGAPKLMPRPDLGPAIAELLIEGGNVRLHRMLRIVDQTDQPVSGLPVPESGHAQCEPTFNLKGEEMKPDPSGMDTEGIAALADGSFWIGEEYGPSLVRVDKRGEVTLRILPEGVRLEGAGYPTVARLPALASKRHLNRGFEALDVSPDERHLYLVFQSPLAHPDLAAHKKARHVRLWQMDFAGQVLAQFLYLLDEPQTFERDNARQKLEPSDIKVCELAAVSDDQLLVLERASETTKLYRVALRPELALGEEHLRVDHRPTIEEMSAADAALPILSKELIFSSDDYEVVAPDLEGMALLDGKTLLLVSDNDFGVEGKETDFFLLEFQESLVTGRSSTS